MCLAAIGRVLDVRDEGGVLVADVEFDNETIRVGADFTPDVRPGMFVLVHAGLAVRSLTAEEAADALALRAEMDAAAGTG